MQRTSRTSSFVRWLLSRGGYVHLALRHSHMQGHVVPRRLRLGFLFIPFITNDMSVGEALIRYIAFVITEGDALNDWLTHLPADVIPHVRIVGEFIATLMGY